MATPAPQAAGRLANERLAAAVSAYLKDVLYHAGLAADLAKSLLREMESIDERVDQFAAGIEGGKISITPSGQDQPQPESARSVLVTTADGSKVTVLPDEPNPVKFVQVVSDKRSILEFEDGSRLTVQGGADYVRRLLWPEEVKR